MFLWLTVYMRYGYLERNLAVRAGVSGLSRGVIKHRHGEAIAQHLLLLLLLAGRSRDEMPNNPSSFLLTAQAAAAIDRDDD